MRMLVGVALAAALLVTLDNHMFDGRGQAGINRIAAEMRASFR